MSKAKRAKAAAEPAEAALDGALDGMAPPADEPPRPENDGPEAAVPDINSPDWTPYVLSRMTPDELYDGCPTVEGLRRMTNLLLGTVVASTSRVVQAPNAANQNHSCVEHTLAVRCSGDHLGDLDGEVLTVTGVADVFMGNGSDNLFSWRYSSATCETRAEGRAYRRALRLRHVVAREELSEVPDAESGADGYAIETQFRGVDMLCHRLKVDAAGYLADCWRKLSPDAKDHSDFRRLPYVVAQRAIATLIPWQQDRAKIPDRLRGGYDPKWLDGCVGG